MPAKSLSVLRAHPYPSAFQYQIPTELHYDADDASTLRVNEITLLNGLPFTANWDYYIVGLLAYLHDPNVFDMGKEWTLYSHGQVNAPVWLQPFLTALGITEWPSTHPAFEAKRIEFYATEDCWVRFVGENREPHFIPAGVWREFERRCLMFWFVRDTANGYLRFDIEG